MGSCSISGTYISTDWRNGISVHFRKNRETGKKEVSYIDTEYAGIEGIQKRCIEECGNDPYNGTASTVDFGYAGDWRSDYKSYLKYGKSIYDYIEPMLDRMGKWDGKVAMIDDAGFLICTTEIEEVRYLDFDSRAYLKGSKGPAVLVAPTSYGRYTVVSSGTVAEMKKQAHSYLRKNNYGTEVYIVGRSKSYIAKAKAKYQEKTTRKNDEKNMILPIHEYVYFGWAAE